MGKWIMACMVALSAVTALCAASAATIIVAVPIPEAPPAPIVGSLANIHSVAVISAIGSQFTLHNHYFLYYHVWPVPIADWKIDERVEASLRNALGGRFTFKNVSYNRDALAAIPNGHWDNSADALRRYLSGLANPGIDAYIVVRPDVEGTVTGNSGLGLWTDHRGKTTPMLNANYEVDIIDAHSFTLISKAFARLDDIPGRDPRVAHLAFGKDLEVEDESVPLPAIMAKLRQASTGLVDRSLAAALRSLQFDVAELKNEPAAFQPIQPEQDIYAPAKSIAVMSVLGDDIALLRQREGIFPGNAASMRASIPSWKLDAAIEARIKADIAKRFVVKDVPYNRAQLAWSTVMVLNNKFTPYCPGLSATDDADLYAVVFKDKTPVWGDTDGFGLGLVNDDQKTLRIFANYAIAIIDAHTLKPLGILYGAPDTMIANGNVAKDVPIALWPAVPPDFDAGQAEIVRQTFVDLLNGSLDATLKLSGLTGEMLGGMPPALTLGPRPK